MSVTPGTAPSLSTSLPVLDLAALQARDPDALAALRGAAHAVGFLSLVGTALAGERTEQVLAAARALLDLPEAEKAAGASYDSPQFRGWTRTGAELTGGRPDRREQIDVGRDETTLPGPLTGDRVGLRLRGPNRWPRGGEAHAAVVTAWLADVERVGLDLLDALLAALGLPPDALAPLLAGGTDDGGADGDGRGHLHAKLLRYPPEPGVQAQGVGAHRDYGLLALLVQDGVGGLQAQLPGDGGAWVDVAPRPDAVVVNLGEMLEVLTDGYLVATPHRVVSPASAPGTAWRCSSARAWTPSSGRWTCPTTSAPPRAGSAPTPPTRCTPCTAPTASRAGCARTPRPPDGTTPTC